MVRIELYAEGAGGGAAERREMAAVRPPDDGSGDYIYTALVPGARPAADYTARLIPRRDGVAMPLEEARILWAD
jgi:starch phosphorylase